MHSEKGYHQLLVWKKTRELIKEVYIQTETFPKEEVFGLTSQVRRAIVSVLLNIVEGDRRSSTKDRLRFFEIADGLLVEVEACLEIAYDLRYITIEELENLEEKRREVAVMLSGLIRSVKKMLE